MELIHGDCLIEMAKMPDNSIDLTVTSPPYDNLRTYGGVIDDWSFEKFQGIAKELYRITKEGGVVVWVVGDATIKGSETGTSFKQALYFMECGFNLHDTMIYRKQNPIPQNHNRYEQCFEYMFVLAKEKICTFNPITIPTKSGGVLMNWGRKNKVDAKQCRRQRDVDFITTKETKRMDNIWTYPIGGGKTGHPAPFPEALANDHILSWSNEGDIIFDPFTGSGTTGKMAILNNRDFIGIELNEDYFKIAEKRINDAIVEKETRLF